MLSTLTRSVTGLVGALMLLGISASPARAALVYDTITVYDATNTPIASLVVTEAQQALDPSAINYLGGVAVDPNQFGNYGIVLAGSTPVDIFGIANGGPDPLDLAFSPGPGAAGYAIQNPVPDTGAPISMTMYLDPSLQSQGYTAWFTASGNFNEDIPEPVSLAFLAAGLAGVFVLRRRRKYT